MSFGPSYIPLFFAATYLMAHNRAFKYAVPNLNLHIKWFGNFLIT